MNPQAVQQRAAAGKMLIEVIVSAQYGSKWEGPVTVPLRITSDEFITACESSSGLSLKGYVISYNGRLLRSINVLYDIGLRDGYQVVLLPMKQGLFRRPPWSVRQSEQVAYILPERARKLKVTEQTQQELLDFLGKDLVAAYQISGLTMHDPQELLKDDPEAQRAQELAKAKARHIKPREDIYKTIWQEKAKPKYKHKEVSNHQLPCELYLVLTGVLGVTIV